MLILNKKYYTFKRIITISFIFTIAIPTIVLFFLQYKNSADILEKKITKNTMDLLTQYNSIIANRFQLIDTYISSIVYDKYVMDFLRETDFSSANRMNSYFLDNEKIYNSISLYGVMLIPFEGDLYYYKNKFFSSDVEKIKHSELYKSTVMLKGRTYWIGWQKSELNASEKPDFYTFNVAKAIIDEKTKSLKGVVCISLNGISDLLPENINDVGILTLYNEFTGAYIPANIKNMDQIQDYKLEPYKLNRRSGYYMMSVGGKPVYLAYSSPNLYGWRLLSQIPLDSLTGEIEDSKNLSITLLAIGLCIFSVYLFIVMREFAIPLRHLLTNVNDIENMNTKINYKRHPCYEFANIGHGIISLVEKNKSINQQLTYVKKESSVLEYQKLQSQINPHFLYNTLNTVKFTAAMNNDDKIRGIITSLIKLLRMSMDKQGEYVTVCEEIQSVKHYLYIENIVYENKISVGYELDDELQNLKVPNFILQPLVENCIMHGIDPWTASGRIIISNYRKENDLFFEVEDNGRGISKEKQEEIFSTIKENRGFSGVGLKSIHNRLQLAFGSSYGISLRTMAGVGCTFVVKIPVIQ